MKGRALEAQGGFKGFGVDWVGVVLLPLIFLFCQGRREGGGAIEPQLAICQYPRPTSAVTSSYLKHSDILSKDKHVGTEFHTLEKFYHLDF